MNIKSFNTALEARVAARNEVNAEYNRLLPILIANFTPLVGQKIMKATGMMEKFKDLVAPTETFHMCRTPSNYSLVFVLKATATYGNGTAVYEEISMYIGNFAQGGTHLESMANFNPVKCDYTVEGIKDLRNKFKAAQKAFDEAKSALNPFGEFDR